jgi:hypothetical protein
MIIASCTYDINHARSSTLGLGLQFLLQINLLFKNIVYETA